MQDVPRDAISTIQGRLKSLEEVSASDIQIGDIFTASVPFATPREVRHIAHGCYGDDPRPLIRIRCYHNGKPLDYYLEAHDRVWRKK